MRSHHLAQNAQETDDFGGFGLHPLEKTVTSINLDDEAEVEGDDEVDDSTEESVINNNLQNKLHVDGELSLKAEEGHVVVIHFSTSKVRHSSAIK